VARIIELHQRGVFLEGLPDEVSRDVTALCNLVTERITDAVLALGLWEEAWGTMWSRLEVERDTRHEAWERDRQAERVREEELWLSVHIFYLIGLQNRVLVLTRWTFSFVTHGRGARLITGEPATTAQEVRGATVTRQ
jgi:hypothetical protein